MGFVSLLMNDVFYLLFNGVILLKNLRSVKFSPGGRFVKKLKNILRNEIRIYSSSMILCNYLIANFCAVVKYSRHAQRYSI